LPDSIANIIVLCEDQEHQNLVRRYLIRAGHRSHTFHFLPLCGRDGSGAQYVRVHFPKQVTICRGILGRRTGCLLIVITDADDHSVRERERTLQHELTQSHHDSVTATEPIVILIPKWQVETWIKCLLGQPMNEGDRNSDRPPVTPDQIKEATETLFEWTRHGAQIGATCVPSLELALPRWRRISDPAE
jgi:hypothetical protein